MSARLGATVVPVRYVRMLAGVLFAVAMGLPWIAARQHLVRFDAGPSAQGLSKPIRLRPDSVQLPGGTFVMGSPASEADRQDDETPHSVNVAPFAIFRTEVTLAQWEAVMGTRPNDCAYGCEDFHPVHKISMYDALRYANRLTDKENSLANADQPKMTRCYDETNWSWDRVCTGYRLPTEAEWEYAARAGTTTAYSFGNDKKELCRYGNFGDAAAKGAHPGWKFVDDICDDGVPNLAPVGAYVANPWGLYDMHGNVWEWVWDKYEPYSDKPVTSDNDKRADTVTNAGSRVLRGGAFSNVPWRLRSASRGGDEPSVTFGNFGFRCVRVVPPQH